MKKYALLLGIGLLLNAANLLATDLRYSKEQLQDKWKTRIQSLLDKGKLPLIDMETSLSKEQIEDYFPAALETFDELGIALISADGFQKPRDGSEGYRWSHYILEAVNKYPDYFIPTANGGTNKNWLAQKSGKSKHYIEKLDAEIRSGKYFNMGELDFRHYMSGNQCRQGRTDRDNDIPLNGENGHRVFKLSQDTGVPFVIHLESEDAPLTALEEMLEAYPDAKVIVAHFTQLRHPEKQTRFTPEYARRLLSKYPNLYYDLAVGHPNRKYKCAGPSNNDVLIGDTALWEGDEGAQNGTLNPAYLDILTYFSNRFVYASDYGKGRSRLPSFLVNKTENFHNIIAALPEEAKHNIAYRNAWRLLTGKVWGE